MIKKLFNNSLIIIFFILLNACRMPDNFGFFQPVTMDLRVPDGPAEFKAGWHDGCKSGLAGRSFLNSYVYQNNRSAEFGNGVYQHDSLYNSSWSTAFYVCSTYSTNFVDYNAMKYGPLQ